MPNRKLISTKIITVEPMKTKLSVTEYCLKKEDLMVPMKETPFNFIY